MPSSISSPKRVLGRGLADLIPVGGDGGAGHGSNGTEIGPGQEVSVAILHRNPRQPRTRFDEAALTELSESIRANGILQPILVRPRTSGGYEIVAGERRYRAALQAGLKQVPVVVRQLTDEETLALALIENLIREDITPLETARAFQRLMDDYGWTQEEMGRRVGKSRSAVGNSLRLLTLPEPIQQSLERGDLTEGHARTLIGDDTTRRAPGFRERQMRIWRQVLERGLSVREVERLMKAERPGEVIGGGAGSGSPSGTERPATGNSVSRETLTAQAERAALEDRLRAALGTQVRLNGSDDRGRIEIEYFSQEELEGLLARLEVSPPLPPIPTPTPTATVTRPKAAGSRIEGLLGSR